MDSARPDSPASPPNPPPARSHGRRWAVACALLVGGLVFIAGKSLEDAVIREAAVLAHGAARRPQVAEIDRALEAMSLITVILESRVTSTVKDESWRGNVDAMVTVPVRLFFGTDLDRARVSVTELSPLARTYRITVPPPRRLATELITDRESANVDLGWLRFRTRAGEYFLGQARRQLSEAAAAMTIDESQALRVRDETRTRLVRLVTLVLGEQEAARAQVRVDFDDDLTTPTTPTASAPEAPR